eukprot:1542669-Amphidinium_carterae.2
MAQVRRAGVSNRSESSPELLNAMHAAASWRREDHPYSSVMVSMELFTGPHKDARNDGYNSVLGRRPRGRFDDVH